MKPDLDLVDLVVRDMEATIAFYRALGVDIPESAIWRTPSGVHHVDVTMPGGLTMHFDSAALAKVYNRGWREPTGTGTRSVLGFKVASREEVDRIHATLTGLGHRSSQPPFDAFWGARYAIVEDPDGNYIGIMSPSDPARRGAPPNV
ncbi:MAG TPA: VOC family protein [Myxococcota bacterium]|nr:VOC family protein [Myxococcota bacterium]